MGPQYSPKAPEFDPRSMSPPAHGIPPDATANRTTPTRSTTPERPRQRWGVCLGVVISLGTSVFASEPRFTATQAPAPWQASVVRVVVPVTRLEGRYRRHFFEECSGTVVSVAGNLRVLTAWHCFDGVDTVGDRTAALMLNNQTIPLRLLQSGGGIDSDWALLEARDPARAPLPAPLPVAALKVAPGDRVLMAGFSRDRGLGAGGAELTFDPSCRVTAVLPGSVSTNCAAHKGASGGPVLIERADGWAVTGVISRGDGEGTSLYAPVPPQLVRAYP